MKAGDCDLDWWATYMDEERRRNRPLTEVECEWFSQWFEVATTGDWESCRVRVQWCEFEAKQFWARYLRNGTIMVFRFTCSQDAMMFKLVHGGFAPPRRKLT